jgi:hypothetical protein
MMIGNKRLMNTGDGNAIFVRVNGVLPDDNNNNSTDGRADKTQAHTSISVFSGNFHLLVDAGSGVASSIDKGSLDIGYKKQPDAILVTNARREHISDLTYFPGTKIFCTSQCADQIANEIPQLKKDNNNSHFSTISPGEPFEVGPFSVLPVAADNSSHGGENDNDNVPGMPGSVIYVIRIGDRKVVAGWDFINLQNANQDMMWNSDLVLFGAETYNEHPSTGMISVTEVYHLVKAWNAKECYILHYSGEKDRENAKNQWHRGPAGPLSPEELQKAIDGYLRISGQDGKFSIKVARQGLVWRPTAVEGAATEGSAEDSSSGGAIGNKIEIEALEKYVFSIEKMPNGKLTFVLEDSINRLINEFVNPRKTTQGNGKTLHADPVKSMMMKGPELNLTVSPDSTVKASITKGGKKPVFADEMRVSERDAKKLERYILENF